MKKRIVIEKRKEIVHEILLFLFFLYLIAVFTANFVIISDIKSVPESYSASESYYIPEERQNKSISELRAVLTEIEYPHSYKENVFDCSEMTAYCEWFLENRGYKTVICTNETWRHAYVRVENLDEGFVYVECVPPIHITNDTRYAEPEGIYEDIEDALKDYPYEFDWWWGIVE